MNSPQAPKADWTSLRLGSVLRDHGCTILIAVIAVGAALHTATDFTLESFEGRKIGAATLAGYDVAARTRLVPLIIAAVAATAAFLAWTLPRLQRRYGRELFEAVENVALPGVLLAFLASFRHYAPSAWLLVPTFLALILLVHALERSGLTNARACDLGRDALWLGAVAWSPLFLVTEFSAATDVRRNAGWWPQVFVIAGGVALYLLRWAVARRADVEESRRLHDRFVHAASALAAVPACLVAYREVFLVLNNRGFESVTADAMRIVVFAALGAWILVRFLRGPRGLAGGRLSMERVLGLCVFPWLVAGLAAWTVWAPVVGPPPDFFEAGNAALLVQQWADFGRVPFVETFSAHGLSDTLFAFVERAVSGQHRASWELYAFLRFALTQFAIYHLLRIVIGAAAPAFFAWIALPYLDRLFHPATVHAIALVFLVAWIARKLAPQASIASVQPSRLEPLRDAASSSRVWWILGFALVFAFAWKLDVGFAGTVAAFATLIAIGIAVPGMRRPWKSAAIGLVGAALTTAIAVGAICAARGVNPIARLRDLMHVVDSSQSFGFEHLAPEWSEIVLWHLYVLPFLVLGLTLLLVARSRGRIDLRERTGFVFVTCVFLAIFTLANMQRGLVRHTFVEAEAAMTSVFTIAVIAFAPAWILGNGRTKTVFAGFVLISGLLAFNFDLARPTDRKILISTARYERIVGPRFALPALGNGPGPIERVHVPAQYVHDHLERIEDFTKRELDPAQTFLELSNCPLLYYHLRRLSPHWLNHLVIVNDDYLQQRALEEWREYDTPLVLMPTDAATAKRLGFSNWDNIDGVELSLRLHRLFENVYANYQPYGVVGPWPVWTRKDWMQRGPPLGEDVVQHFEWAPGGSIVRAASGDQRITRVSMGDSAAESVPLVETTRERALYLRIEAESSAGGDLSLAWTADEAGESTSATRSLRWSAGATERHYVLPSVGRGLALARLSLTASSDVRLRRVELVSSISKETSAAAEQAFAARTSPWGRLALLWGETDAELREELPLLRDVEIDGTSNPRTAEPRHPTRFEFEDLEPTGGGEYVVLRLAATGPADRDVRFVYGEGAETRGTFVFRAAGEGATRTYALRVTTQPNWALRTKNWISLEPTSGSLVVESARIVKSVR